MGDTMNFKHDTILITNYASIDGIMSIFYELLLRSNNMSTFLDLMRLRFFAVISPALENSLSEGTDVAGIVRNFLACGTKK